MGVCGAGKVAGGQEAGGSHEEEGGKTMMVLLEEMMEGWERGLRGGRGGCGTNWR